MIGLSLTGKRLEDNLQEIQKYKTHLDLCELRADCLEKWDVKGLRDFPRQAGIPLILSIRRRKDGGFWEGSEDERSSLFTELLSSGFAYLDLEQDSNLSAVSARALQNGVRIIRSFHDSRGVPENLVEIIRALPGRYDEIPRVVIKPLSVADLRLILRALRETSGERIIQGLGEWGVATRILSGAYGCLCTLLSSEAAKDDLTPLSPENLEELYRYRTISLSSAVYGIIGNPVLHTQSPLIHNTAYARQKKDAVYLPFQVDDVKEFFSLASELPVQGFSVTIPHKSEVIPHLVQVSDDVSAIGACNTVVRSPEGFVGYNTDVFGFIAPLKKMCSNKIPRRAVVIGAGGAARAAVYGLKTAGADVLIVNRTESKAVQMAQEFSCRSSALAKPSYRKIAEYAELIVQTTSAGMHPLEDIDPLEGYPWTGKEIAYDLIYVPETTRFLSAAKAAGCKTLNGAQMLQAQGEAQYKLFTGTDYPSA